MKDKDISLLESLPVELQIQIFSLLDNTDLVLCLTICKTWCNLVQQKSLLYQSVNITNLNDFEKLCSFFKRHPEFRPLVKRLCIEEIGLPLSELPLLPATFPNVEEFYYYEENKPYRQLLYGPETPGKWNAVEAGKAFSAWKDKLKCIHDLGTPFSALALLSKGLCVNLVHITMSFIGMENEKEKLKFIKNLAHAPNLTSLRTSWITYGKKDIENIHKYAPNLRALSFYQVGFFSGRSKRAEVTVEKTADKIETLTAEYASFLEPEGPWIRYFAQKYPNLENFIVLRGDDEDNDKYHYEDNPNGTSDYQLLATNCKKLECFRAYGLKFDKPFLRALDNGGIQLKTMALGTHHTHRFFELLMKSNQINSIESLTLSGCCFADMTKYREPSINFIKKLAKFPNLKHLRINESKEEVMGHDHNRVPLDLLLQNLRHIQSITMDFATFEIAEETDTPFDTTLKKLILEECYVEAAKYKGQDKMHEKSEEFLIKKKLPNAKIIFRGMDDAPDDEDWRHLYSYKSHFI